MNNLFSMFKEESGKWSSQRVVSVSVTAFWTLLIGIVWVVSSLKTNVLQSIPDSVIMLYTGISGIALGAKVLGSATKKSDKN